MLAVQVKAFSLLFVALLIVDAAAFEGEYRQVAGEKLGRFFSAIAPSSWQGPGQGRDWSAPSPPRR